MGYLTSLKPLLDRRVSQIGCFAPYMSRSFADRNQRISMGPMLRLALQLIQDNYNMQRGNEAFVEHRNCLGLIGETQDSGNFQFQEGNRT